MIRLITIELRRVFARRVVRALVALVLLAILVMALSLAIFFGEPTAAEKQSWESRRAAPELWFSRCKQSIMDEFGGRPPPPIEFGEEVPDDVQSELKRKELARYSMRHSKRECSQGLNDMRMETFIPCPNYEAAVICDSEPAGFFAAGALALLYRWLPFVGIFVALMFGSTLGGGE